MALTDKLTAIADAVRGKTGGTDALSLDQMATEIANIETGGGSDNSLLHSILDRSITSFVDNEITKLGDYAFNSCTKLTTFSAPNVTAIGQYAFGWITGLTELTFPKLSDAGFYFLERCTGLTKVDIGENCKLLKGGAFRYNQVLNTVILRAQTLVSIASNNVFSGTPFDTAGSGAKVYVPSALIESYQTATNWSTLYAANKLSFVAIEGSEYE